MGNKQPRKYAYFTEFTEEKMFIALYLGFEKFHDKFKVRKGDIILYIGEFNLDLLNTLPPCTLIVIDKSASFSYLLPYSSNESLLKEPDVKCLRIRSFYLNFLSIFLEALREFQIKGSSLGRLKDLLNSTILSWTFNGGSEKKFYFHETFSPAFYMETNSPDLFSFLI